MLKNGMRPVHPGEILREDYLRPLAMSVNALSKHLRVPASRINDIVLERRGVTADTALRLARFFGGDAQTWLNLQTQFDLCNGLLRLDTEDSILLEGGAAHPPQFAKKGHTQ
ncbi:putative HTH-type transcriptional regulator YbaQ [Burkholderiales bacterium]|nr:putative HTH-type transcriptional regulator YbaQ [Burkholderiales bacterium]